ncbi:hypothetical protein [Mycoplana sp. BE70]|uniref:hypothetical protein n=1 Tax=Mycoplana sp. BE70 TaxID=2817775 RepID=UPI00286AEA45|nr:hypothetical protein [Mycoplana sp. BE70]
MAVASAALAQDTLESFSQITTPKKSGKLTSFNPLVTGESEPQNLRDVNCDALLTEDGSPMQHGLSWRIFSPIPGADGKLPLLATSEGGSAAFRLVPGEYFVNVAFGRAAATKKLLVPESGSVEKQVMVLDAGGITLNAVSGSDVRIPPNDLTFSIYASEVGEDGERSLIAPDVKPNTVVRLNAGTYHVVSDYGTVNAVIRADIQVEAGKLIQATIQHRAAQLTLKLVSEEGGEAIADTAWSILTSSGDVVSESVGAFPTLVLAEGQYTAVARNKKQIYQRDFTVTAGQNTDVEVLLTENPDQQAQVITD